MKQILVNLIPPNLLLARQSRGRRRGWSVALIVQATLMVGVGITARQIWQGGSPSLAAELSDANQEISRLNVQIIKQRKLAAETVARQSLLNAIADKPDWSTLLKLIDQTISDDITLRRMQLQENNEHQLDLSMHGVAQSQNSVAQFVLRLQQDGLFKNIRLTRSEREPFMSGSAISFDLLCPIDGISGALP